jgi:N utilization substance protein B
MRSRARRLALQAIYQWQLNPSSETEIVAQFHEDMNPKKIDAEYFDDLVKGVIQNLSQLNETIIPCLDRSIEELNQIELAIIRIASYELVHRLDIPYKVVINEALNLAKTFGAADGYKYVNAVLDKIAKNIRTEQQ